MFDAGILIATFLIGFLSGFVGIGGGGMVVGVLTTLFQIPVHLVIGTTLAGMVFTTASAATSHVREGNTELWLGVGCGVGGAIGAVIGASLAPSIDGAYLKLAGGAVLWLSATLFLLRTRVLAAVKTSRVKRTAGEHARRAALGGLIALGAGVVAGMVGIGAAVLVQLGLLVALRVEMRVAVGTVMLMLVLVSIAGGVRYVFGGLVDPRLLLNIAVGTAVGSYAGAKLTRRVAPQVLRWSIAGTLFASGSLLIFGAWT